MKQIRIEFCFPDAKGVCGYEFVADDIEATDNYIYDLDYARRMQAEFVEFKAVNGKVLVKLNNINMLTVTDLVTLNG